MITGIPVYNIFYDQSCSSFKIESLLNGNLIQVTGWQSGIEMLNKMNLSIDNIFIKAKYGFEISPYEVISHIATKYVLAEFTSSTHNVCLIIDKTAQSEYDVPELFNELADLDGDWDIYFPFDRAFYNENARFEAYAFGQMWGLDAFFLTKKGAKIISEINIVRQPLDEEILDLSSASKINVYYNDSESFFYKENPLRNVSRNEAIESAIYSTDHWTDDSRRQIQFLLRRLNELASQHGIELILSYGSLLGYIRHGGIMPWDDDVDLLLSDREIERFIEILKNEDAIKCTQEKWRHIDYYKVWLNSGDEIPGLNYRFPFIDIWLFQKRNGYIILEDGIEIPVSSFYPLQKVIFEESSYYIPADPLQSLDLTYKNWRTDLFIYPWNHRLEQPVNRILSAKISVDSNGKIIKA
ncbi:LicD family protein [Agriterribacter sp.]|uniref:LicD family protein n=1 Tax=Agriterribacter sp. TaxID=2821509 RepID=UPI002CBB3A1B|nr:LicD family protein [Agriterribacter sp.]HTN08414.1 LicD family protein [Agriterribacter sp.]